MQKITWTANNKYYHKLMLDNMDECGFNVFKYYIMVVLFAWFLVNILFVLDTGISNISSFLTSFLFLPISVLFLTITFFFIHIYRYIVVTMIFLLISLSIRLRKNKKIKKKLEDMNTNINKDTFYNVEIEFTTNSLKIHIMGKEYIIPYLDVLHFARKNKYILIYFKNNFVLRIPKTSFNPPKNHIDYLNNLTEEQTIKYIQSKENIDLEHVLGTIDYKYKKWFNLILTLIVSVIFSINMLSDYTFVLPIYLICIIIAYFLVKKKHIKKWKEKISTSLNKSAIISNGRNLDC